MYPVPALMFMQSKSSCICDVIRTVLSLVLPKIVDVVCTLNNTPDQGVMQCFAFQANPPPSD